MNMIFRQARPEDAQAAAGLIYSAGPEAIRYAFATKKHPPEAFVRSAFIEGSGIIGFKNHIVAEVEGRVAAIGAFYPAAHFNLLSRAMVWQIFRFYGVFKSCGVLKRGARLETVMPAPPEDALFIQNVAVAAEMRGRGVGTALFEERIEAARRDHFSRCILDVAANNPRARNFYDKRGFRIVEKRNWKKQTRERKCPYCGEPVHVPDYIRMALRL